MVVVVVFSVRDAACCSEQSACSCDVSFGVGDECRVFVGGPSQGG